LNRRYSFALASVLLFICLVCVLGLIANAFNIIALENAVKNISVMICVLSGYFAAFFCGIGLQNREKAQNLMKKFLFVLFVFYLVLLIDFTLINNGYGRDILSVFDPDRSSFRRYLKESTNFIPFATVKLFIKGYVHHNLSWADTAVNLLGNFAFFMPLAFFICLLKKERISFFRMFIFLFVCIVSVECLQVVFMTGSCDIDDLILNLSGAMLFYFVICRSGVSKILTKLTFGVWK